MHTSNTFKTVILPTSLAGFLVLIGTMLGGTTGLVIGSVLGLGIVGAPYWSSDMLAVKAARASFASTFGGNTDDDSPNPAVAMMLAIVTPLAGGLMLVSLSRSREFEADRLQASR